MRLNAKDQGERALQARALQQAAQSLAADEVLVLDAGFHVAELQHAKVARFVLRGPRNFTARRAQPPAYKGRGRRPTYGEVVRPLSRKHKDKTIAATPPDQVDTWQEDGYSLRAAFWFDLVRAAAPGGSPTFAVVVIYDPRYTQPLLLISNVRASGAVLRDLYGDRWPIVLCGTQLRCAPHLAEVRHRIEQLPLVAKQLIGAERQWVSAAESCLRLPELSRLAGHVLSYLAATQPAVPTGFWDRSPRRTPARLRRALARADFFKEFTLPSRMREKHSPTKHLPKGFNAHLRQPFAHPQQN